MKKIILIALSVILTTLSHAQKKPSEMSPATVSSFKNVLGINSKAEKDYVDTTFVKVADLVTPTEFDTLNITAKATAPTMPVETSSTDVATTGFVKNQNTLQIRALKRMGSVVKYMPIHDRQPNALSFTLIDGSIYEVTFDIEKQDTITGIRLFTKTKGDFTADNFNGAAMFSLSGGTATQIAISANDANFFKTNANTASVIPFTAPVIVSPGIYKVCFMANWSAVVTSPAFGADNPWGANGQNLFGLTNSNKIASVLAGQTAMPASYEASAWSGATGYFSVGLY